MKLNNTLRDAFVRAAMDDVPRIDYEEKIRVLVQDDAISKLPPKILAVWKDKNLRHFIATSNRVYGGRYINIVNGSEYVASDAIKKQIDEWIALESKQEETRTALRSKIKSIAYTSSTRKDLFGKLPEFEKYMPADEAAACKTLPMVVGVVDEFIKAGWPKSAAAKPKSATAKRGA